MLQTGKLSLYRPSQAGSRALERPLLPHRASLAPALQLKCYQG